MVFLPFWNSELYVEISPQFPYGRDFRPFSLNRFNNNDTLKRIAPYCDIVRECIRLDADNIPKLLADDDIIVEAASKTKLVLTVEEHSIIGGLGSAVSDYYADKAVRPLIYKGGLPDEYPHASSHETMMQEYKLDKDGIYNRIETINKGGSYV